MIESAKIGDKLFMSIGCADPLYWDCVYAMYCNKQLAEKYNLPDLYALVREGIWTFDKLIEYSALAEVDLNGDGKMDENDQFGYLTGNNMEMDALIPACDVKITAKDKDGLPVLLGLTERYIDVQNMIESFMKTGSAFYACTDCP